MSQLNVDTIKKADGTGNLSVPAETGTVVTTASPSLGRRNLIINGAMQVAQRGTSATSQTTTGYKTCDRMDVYILNGGTYTITQDTDAPEGFSNSLKYACTATSSDAGKVVGLRIKLEGQNLQQLKYGTSNAQDVTLSFWIKSNLTGTCVFAPWLSTSSKIIGRTFAIDSADTWEYKTITIPGNTSGALANDNTDEFQVFLNFSVGSNFTSGTLPSTWTSYVAADSRAGQTVDLSSSTSNYLNITGVQLEVGSVATPFEHRSYGESLAACQRYYQIIQEGAGSRDTGGSLSVPGEQLIATGFCFSSSRVMGSYRYPHLMRAVPSSALSSASHFSVLRPTGWSTATSMNIRTTDKYARLDLEGVSVTAGNAAEIRIESGTGGKIEFDAEL
jgi:hypothetical protein